MPVKSKEKKKKKEPRKETKQKKKQAKAKVKEKKAQKKDQDSIAKEILSDPEQLTKTQLKSQNKTLKIIFITFFLVIILILAAYFIAASLKTYTYNGVEFVKTNEGGKYGDKLIVYRTSIPVVLEGKQIQYNFYFRTNPRELARMDFDKQAFKLKKYTVFRADKDFACDGYGLVAVANLVQLHEAVGMQMMNDKDATCDEEARYLYLHLKEGEETKIEKVGENCYDLYINDCEILKVTEKVMLEMFVELKKTL